jgi:hypothetical protein
MHVDALAGDRVDHVGRVTDEREAVGDEIARHLQAQRIGDGPVEKSDRAEAVAEARLQFVEEELGGQPAQALGAARLLGPDDGGAATRQRQDGEGAGGQEVLLGASLVVVFVADGADDAGLAVVPADGADAGEVAQARPSPVAGDEQSGRDACSVAQRYPGRRRTGFVGAHGGRPHLDTQRPGAVPQRAGDGGVGGHVGEGFARRDLAREGEEDRPDDIERPAVGHHHVEDRLRLRHDLVPHADRLEHAARSGREGGGAALVGGRGCDGRVGDGDGEGGAERGLDRNSQGQAGEAAAGNQEGGAIV